MFMLLLLLLSARHLPTIVSYIWAMEHPVRLYRRCIIRRVVLLRCIRGELQILIVAGENGLQEFTLVQASNLRRSA